MACAQPEEEFGAAVDLNTGRANLTNGRTWLIASEDDRFITLKVANSRSMNGWHIQQFDTTSHLVLSRQMDVRDHYADHLFCGGSASSSEISFLTLSRSWNSDSAFLLRWSMNRKTDRCKEDPEVLFSTGPISENHDIYEIDWVQSPGKKYNLIWMPAAALNPHQGILAYLCDEHLRVTWAGEMRVPYNAQEIQYRKVFVDDQGRVHVVYGLEKSESGSRGTGNTVEVFSYNPAGKLLATNTLQEKGYYFARPHVYQSSEGNLVVVGTFSGKKEGYAKGVFRVAIDGQLSRSFPVYHPFDADFIKESTYMRDHENWALPRRQEWLDEMRNYYLHQSQLLDNGNIVIVLSHRSVYQDVLYRKYTAWNNVALICVGPTGAVLWQDQVRKRQLTRDPGNTAMGQKVIITGQGVYCIYNDKWKHKKKPGAAPAVYRPGKWQKTSIRMVRVDFDGNRVEKRIVFPDSPHRCLIPRSCVAVSDSTLFIYTEGSNQKQHMVLAPAF